MASRAGNIVPVAPGERERKAALDVIDDIRAQVEAGSLRGFAAVAFRTDKGLSYFWGGGYDYVEAMGAAHSLSLMTYERWRGYDEAEGDGYE